MKKNEMDENVKHLVFGVCIAFVMLGAFAGVSVALASATTIPDNYLSFRLYILDPQHIHNLPLYP